MRDVRFLLHEIRGRSPHDFVPATPVDLDWRRWVEGETDDRPPATDLRLLWDGPRTRVATLASVLTWDTQFFGVKTARIDAILPLDGAGYASKPDLGPAVRDFRTEARARGVEYVFAIVDERDSAVCRALAGSDFREVERRLTYWRSIADPAPPESHSVRLATEADIPSLQQVAVSMVNPHDRFRADPVLAAETVDRLMAEWVRASVTDGFADFVLVPDEPEPGAFVTARTHEADWAAQGIALCQPVVLGAVLPRLRGWYLHLLNESCRVMRDRGATHAYVVTQEENGAARRTFEKAGFAVGRRQLVFRWCTKDSR